MADPDVGNNHRLKKTDLCGMMRAAGGRPDSHAARREALGLFRNNLADLTVAEADLLAAFREPVTCEADRLAAFRGPAKWDYVELWTREPLPATLLADVLAVHLAHLWQPPNTPTLQWDDAGDDKRLLRADYARTLARDAITPALARAVEQAPEIARPDGAIDPVGALVWLRQHEPSLVPEVFGDVGQAPGDRVGDTEISLHDLPSDREEHAGWMQAKRPEVRDKDVLFKEYSDLVASLPVPRKLGRKAFRDLIPSSHEPSKTSPAPPAAPRRRAGVIQM